jgi:hypothetical protein
MSDKRFGTYVHGDSTTSNKGAAIVALTGGGDFAALAARMAYGAGAFSWADVAATFPEAEAARADLGAEVTGLAVLRLASGEAGRVEALAGTDAAAAIKVSCTTDFAARTDAFRAFSATVADAALRLGASDWAALAAAEPRLEAELVALEREIREKVAVTALVALGGR